MNCSDARHLIHLDVGDDLRADEEQQLAGHMDHCAECRAYYAGMSSAMSALLVLRDVPSVLTDRDPSNESVWPTISREIQKRRTPPAKARKFNLQVAALSVCSLSLAVVTIVQSLSSMRGSMDSSGFMPAQSVSRQMTPTNESQPQYDRSTHHEPQDGEFVPAFPESANSRPQSF